jgi:hypothetical protein
MNTNNELYNKTFETVIHCYLDNLYNLKHSPISAINIEPLKPTRRDAFNATNYVVDVENACRSAIGGFERLEDTLDQILKEEATDVTDVIDTSFSLIERWIVIEKCAKTFIGWQLQPSKYFKHIRHGSAA